MSNRSSPKEPWDPREFAFYGALLGLVLGIAHAYVHAFWSQSPKAATIQHIFSEMALNLVGGAALLAAVAVIRNELIRRP